MNTDNNPTYVGRPFHHVRCYVRGYSKIDDQRVPFGAYADETEVHVRVALTRLHEYEHKHPLVVRAKEMLSAQTISAQTISTQIVCVHTISS